MRHSGPLCLYLLTIECLRNSTVTEFRFFTFVFSRNNTKFCCIMRNSVSMNCRTFVVLMRQAQLLVRLTAGRHSGTQIQPSSAPYLLLRVIWLPPPPHLNAVSPPLIPLQFLYTETRIPQYFWKFSKLQRLLPLLRIKMLSLRNIINVTSAKTLALNEDFWWDNK
jgi:hypothetical protein